MMVAKIPEERSAGVERRVVAQRVRQGDVLVSESRGRPTVRRRINSSTVVDGRVYICCGDGSSPVFTVGRMVTIERASAGL